MSLTKLKRQIVELESKGSVDKVIELLEKAIGEYPNEGTLFNKLGDLYVKKNKTKDAVDVYIKGVEAFKNETYFSNAIALCKKILRYEKDRIEVYRYLGELHGELGQKGEAANYYLQYADREFSNENVEPALDAYLHIKELLPNNPKVVERIGDIYQQLNRGTDANKLYQEAIKLYIASGEKEKAEKLKSKVGVAEEKIEEPADVSIENLVSPEVAELLKAEEEAEEKVEEKEEVVKKEPEVAEKAAQAEEAEEKVEEEVAEEIAVEVTEEKPPKEKETTETVAKTIELAELYLSLDQNEEALECFSNAAELSFKNKDYDKAREIYVTISKLKPVDLKVRQRLIEVANRTNDTELAESTMIEMAKLLIQREAKSQAKNILKKTLEINPKSKSAKKLLKQIKEKEKEYIDLGDILRTELGTEEPARLSVGELIQEFRKEVFESIGESDFKSHYDLGVAYKEMGLYSEAIEEFGISMKDN
ncbi:MAG TPA: hypothetical protein EYP58_00755, partial [bacterium (Candidatus Stahlbacteria)]|nr:hypothetical protein [Candidatus Stahlbacteria bacterium]